MTCLASVWRSTTTKPSKSLLTWTTAYMFWGCQTNSEGFNVTSNTLWTNHI